MRKHCFEEQSKEIILNYIIKIEYWIVGVWVSTKRSFVSRNCVGFGILIESILIMSFHCSCIKLLILLLFPLLFCYSFLSSIKETRRDGSERVSGWKWRMMTLVGRGNDFQNCKFSNIFMRTYKSLIHRLTFDLTEQT